MSKRVWAMVLAVAMVLSLMVTPVNAANVASGTCGDNLTWTLDSSGTLTISGTGAMTDYTCVWTLPETTYAPWWYDYAESIKTVVIEPGVTSIGDSAFFYCTNVTSVTISDTVTSIGYGSFYSCDGLTSITVPDSVSSIDGCAFRFCNNLSSVTLSSNLVSIGNLVFDACAITSITIPASVTSISTGAFHYCPYLSSITFEGNAPTFGENVFSNTTATAYYPADNDTWTEDVMQDYGGTITWVAYTPEPATSGTCGDNAYWSFDAATGTLTISGTGNMYNYEYATAPWYNYYPDITSVVIEDGITSIGDYAFMDCWMTSITLPDTLTSIGEEAFMFCTQLTGITLPDSLVSIGARAFEWCNFESIIIPGSVTSIGDGAFYMCDGLTEITIPSSVTSIGEEVFSWCESLEEIKFLGDAPVIGENAFLHISEATAYYPAGNDTWTEDVRQQYGAYSITWVAYEVEPTDPEPTDDNPFTDVNTGHYFYNSVLWAVEQGITSGTTETTFSPFLTAERCQVVTFLWRAAGCPEPTSTENPFTDVNEGDYFYNAVLWAVEQGITTGTSDTTFSPYTTCERCQVVTFLYRYAGEPEVTSSENPFTDVNEENYFYNAVLWAVENSVTSGTTDTTFGPFVTCERCMVVTFLYRALVE